MAGDSVCIRINYPEMSALNNVRRKSHYSGDRPDVLLQMKGASTESEEQMWAELTKPPILPAPLKLPPLETSEDEKRSISFLHKSRSSRRQPTGNVFTNGGPTSNLCDYQVP